MKKASYRKAASPSTLPNHHSSSPHLSEVEKASFENKYKDNIVESLRFLVNNERMVLFGFVVLQNHLFQADKMKRCGYFIRSFHDETGWLTATVTCIRVKHE